MDNVKNMNVIEFVSTIKNLIPAKVDFCNMPKGFADIYISQLYIAPKKNIIKIDSRDAVIDLVLNYDVSRLTIGFFSFNSELKENEDFIFFGEREAFPIAISKKTNEIVEIDWADYSRIISYIAKDQQSFLSLLVKLEKLNQEQMFKIIDSDDYKKQIISLYKIAGGDKYRGQLEDLL